MSIDPLKVSTTTLGDVARLELFGDGLGRRDERDKVQASQPAESTSASSPMPKEPRAFRLRMVDIAPLPDLAVNHGVGIAGTDVARCLDSIFVVRIILPIGSWPTLRANV